MTEREELIERYGQPPFWDDIQPYLDQWAEQKLDKHGIIEVETGENQS